MSYSPPGLVAPRPARNIWSIMFIESLGAYIDEVTNGAGPSSQNYPAVNTALYVPFSVNEPLIVVKLFVWNGAAVAGNIDMGIYLPDGTKVVSKGSTAQAGTSTIQELDITDTALVPGQYYLAISSDTSGVTQKMFNFTVAIDDLWRGAGVYQQATAFPLPSPATFAVCAQVQVPWIGFSTRTLIV